MSAIQQALKILATSMQQSPQLAFTPKTYTGDDLAMQSEEAEKKRTIEELLRALTEKFRAGRYGGAGGPYSGAL
jgi:conjugal transfer/entry exclusion protein